jgi:hypothetical protein
LPTILRASGVEHVIDDEAEHLVHVNADLSQVLG